MFDDIRQLIDTLLKIEALHAGATTLGERDAAGAAIERIKKKLDQFVEADPPKEMKCTFSNHWSKQLFCALAKRYDLQPFRYYRQRYTTVMIRVPQRFLDEVLWPEFEALDDVLEKYINEMTAKIISEAIFKGSAEEEIRDQPLIESEVKELATPKTNVTFEPDVPKKPTTSSSTLPHSVSHPIPPPVQKVARNNPCPCGSGRKFKRCCGKR
jgi:preprotein translocase subunit SecA